MAGAPQGQDRDLEPPAKRTRQEERAFLPSWKTTYPWVYLDEAGAMRCRYCVDARRTNAFTSGCRTFKKDNLAKHVQTSDHRASLSAISGRRDMERAIANAHRSEEQAVIAAFKTVYFMAKKNLASDIFSDLKEFLIVQVCPLYVVSDSLLTKMVIEALLQCVLLTLQGNTAIGDLTFRSNRGVRTFTYEHSESVRGFQVNH